MSAPVEETQLVDDVEETKPIDKWDGAAVKNRLDDAVKYFFTSDLKYSENFLLIDIRLAISSAAVGVAMYALVADYLSPFPGSRPILLACVLAYFAVMVILTLYTTLVEKGIFLKASKDNKVSLGLIWNMLNCILTQVCSPLLEDNRLLVHETLRR